MRWSHELFVVAGRLIAIVLYRGPLPAAASTPSVLHAAVVGVQSRVECVNTTPDRLSTC